MQSHLLVPITPEEVRQLARWHDRLAAVASTAETARMHERAATSWREHLRYWVSRGQIDARPDSDVALQGDLF